MTKAGGHGSESLLRSRIDRFEANLHREILAGMDWRPAFHLLATADATDECLAQMRTTLRSLARQSYEDWRLVVVLRPRNLGFDEVTESIASGTETVVELRQAALRLPDRGAYRQSLLEGARDEGLGDRIEVIWRSELEHLSDLAASDRAGFIALLQPGDVLGADALAELAVETGLNGAAEFFYSDEECHNPQTGEVEAFCKPGWSPDLLLATNYIGRLWCASSQLLLRTGSRLGDLLRHGEYDLVLRCIELARGIHHVPSVLCRRGAERLDPEPTEQCALERALARRGLAGRVEAGLVPGSWHIARDLPRWPRVSAIIPTAASRGLIRTCIDTLRRKTDYPDLEIVCIDTIPASERAEKDWLRDNADVVLAYDGPFNWSRLNNLAAKRATGELLLFLNDDVEAAEHRWLKAMVQHAVRPEIGAVGARLLYPDGSVQHAGMFLVGPATGRHAFRHQRRDDPGYFGLGLTERNVAAVTGACLLTRRVLFEELGGFEEAHDIINNDLDYCLKIGRRGLRCLYTPFAMLTHHERATRKETADRYDAGRFDNAWRDVFARGDPYHHPWLSPRVDDLAFDPEHSETLSVARPLFGKSEIRRIAVLKLDHIGDCIGAIPALRRLKQVFPEAEILMLTGSWTAAIWSMVPEVDEVVPLDFFQPESHKPPRALMLDEIAKLRARLAPFDFDLAVDFRRHPETRHILRYTGARYTAGFDYEARFSWLDIALEWDGDIRGRRKHEHFGEALIHLVDAIAAAAEPISPVLPLAPRRPSALSEEELDAIFRNRVVCVHAGAGNDMKRWPQGHFVDLIDRLVEHEDVNIVLVGAAAEQPLAAEIRRRVRRADRVWVLAGRIGLADLPGFIAGCALFIGNDSGPKHIAAGLGVPTIGIHSGVGDAREWGPSGPRALAVRRKMTCSPCYLTRPRDCDRGIACLTELRPADIYPLCRRLLALRHGETRLRERPARTAALASGLG